MFRKINWFLPTAKLFGCFHFCTVTLHLMVNGDPLSAIVPIMAVDQSPVNIEVLLHCISRLVPTVAVDQSPVNIVVLLHCI